jgi:hypothetical protein
MSETVGPDAVDAGSDPGMYLPNLITDAVNARSNRGAQWLAENAIDPETGKRVFTSRQVAWTLMTKPKRAFLDPDEFRALCALFNWEPEFLRDACMITLRINIPPRAGGLFSSMIPPGVDELPTRRQFLYRDLLIAAVEDNAARQHD